MGVRTHKEQRKRLLTVGRDEGLRARKGNNNCWVGNGAGTDHGRSNIIDQSKVWRK